MFISPTSTSFSAGKVKLTGLTMDDLSVNFQQIPQFALRKQLDFSIIKHGNNSKSVSKDIYTIIASKDVEKTSRRLYGTSVLYINNNSNKDYLCLQILNAILNAIDELNAKIKKVGAIPSCATDNF